MQKEREGLPSEYSELIKEWQWATSPVFGNYSYVQDMHTADVWLEIRDRIKGAGLEQHPEVIKLDKQLIKRVLKHGAEGSYESQEHPLHHWWWHLDKIARKEYPAELLPEYLREIYLSF